MVTLAQRIEMLRTEQGMSRPQLSAALGLPKAAVEKFETGRQTPTKEQQEKLAAYFGVSLAYLNGGSGDRSQQEDWMAGAAASGEPGYRPIPAAAPAPPKPTKSSGAQGAVFDSLLASKQVQELLRATVLDTLRSPEGQAIIAKAVKKALESS